MCGRCKHGQPHLPCLPASSSLQRWKDQSGWAAKYSTRKVSIQRQGGSCNVEPSHAKPHAFEITSFARPWGRSRSGGSPSESAPSPSAPPLRPTLEAHHFRLVRGRVGGSRQSAFWYLEHSAFQSSALATAHLPSGASGGRCARQAREACEALLLPPLQPRRSRRSQWL